MTKEKSDVFWKCAPQCWSGVRERAFTIWLSVDRWNAQPTEDQSCLKDVQTLSRSEDGRDQQNSTKTKRANFVFDSSMNCKPVQSAKMRYNVVCLRSFQDQAGCIVLNLMRSVQKVSRASGREGIATDRS